MARASDLPTPSSDQRPQQVDGCPFCDISAGRETTVNSPADIVLSNRLAIALISPRWWASNRGHVLVVPRGHYENLYCLPRDHGHAIHDLIHDVAVAMRASYDCQGISVRQHNEPAGNQDVPHYHAHVFPRNHDDALYGSQPMAAYASAADRQFYATKLRTALTR